MEPAAIPGVRLLPVPQAVKGLLLFTAAPAALVRALLHLARGRTDVVHGHAHITQWFNLWRLLFGGRTPYFYHLHITFAGREESMHARGIPFAWNERINNWAGKLCDAWGCRAATHVFAVNESVKEEAVRLVGVDPARITVIRNGVNAALFRLATKDPALMVRFGLDARDRVLLFVGVFNERKNVAGLLEALALLPADVKLVLAGQGSVAHTQFLREKAKALGLEARVRWAGYVAYPELPLLYALCDAFVLPSLYEGFPKVLLEALACGKPAVIHQGYPLDHDVERFVDKADCTDPADLAARLGESLARGFKGEHAEFLRIFSWRSILADVERIYARHLPAGKGFTPDQAG